MSVLSELAEMGEQLTEALGARDAKAVADVYDENAFLLLHGLPLVRGRQAIYELTKKAFEAQAGTDRTPYFQECTEYWEIGDKVIEIGTYVGSGADGVPGKYVLVHQRQADGTLKIFIDSSTSNA